MINELNPKQAHDLLSKEKDAVFVDVRTTAEYEAGHPANTLNVPVMFKGAFGMSPNPEFLAVMLANVPKNKKVIVSCLSGGRSMRACQMLEQNGWTDLVNVQGGWGGGKTPTGEAVPGWSSSGLPSETGNPATRSYDDLKKKVK